MKKVIKTKFFGDIEIDESKVITFPDGIPGFEDLNNFLFMTDKEDNSPFCWLQSIEDINIVFTLFDVYTVIKDYNPKVNFEDITSCIGDFLEEDILIYTVANIPSDITKISVNLKAPIVINLKNNKAKQVITENEEYEIRTYIYDQIKKGGE